MIRYRNPLPPSAVKENLLVAKPSNDFHQRRLLTPTALFYVRNHGNIPCINPNNFQLTITGLTKKTLTLSLADIKEEFPKVNLISTLLCTNESDERTLIRGDQMWSKAAISTAKWGGIRLRHLLLAAGVEQGARYISFAGLDEVPNIGGITNYKSAIPLHKAMSPEVLLAYEMNDEPLPPMHGYPLRAIVPGYASARSVKWLSQIKVSERPEAFHPESNEKQTLNLIINHPGDGETIFDEVLVLEGYALPNAGHLIEVVEVSADGGKSWTPAQILQKENPWEWCFWEAQVKLPVGAHQVVVRVLDSSAKARQGKLEGNKNAEENTGIYWETRSLRIVEED
jgi:sulfite oxidase